VTTPVPRPNITDTGKVKTKWRSCISQDNQTLDLKIWVSPKLLLFLIEDETNMFTVLLYPQGFSRVMIQKKVINQVNWK